MAKQRSGNFSVFASGSSLSRTDAKQLFSKLQTAGYENPTKWHAQRAEKLLDRAFIIERTRAGKSEHTAKVELNRLKREGVYSPTAWHAQRFGKLLDKSFTKQREKMGVPLEVAKKELSKIKRSGETPGRKIAKSLPTPAKSAPVSGTISIDTMEQYYALLEMYADQVDYEEWVSSLDY